jgi:hypothetical protein
MQKAIAVLCFLAASPALATVVQTATCEIDASDHTINLSSSGTTCSLSAPYYGFPGVVATASANAGGNVGFFNILATVTDFSPTAACFACPYLIGTGSTSTITETYFVATSGPLRQGFMDVLTVGTSGVGTNDDPGGERACGSASVGAPGLYVAGSGCDPWSASTSTCANKVSCTVPITLGQANMAFTLYASMDGGDGRGQSEAEISFEFFEADGITPVAYSVSDVLVTSEPATLLLSILGVALMAGMSHRTLKLIHEERTMIET